MKEFLIRLFLLNKGARKVVVPAHLGLALGSAILFALFLLGSQGWNYVNLKLLGTLPGQELRVGLKKKDLSFFRMTEPGSATLDRAALDRMAAIEGVDRVWPITYGSMPSYVEVNFLGNELESEIVIQGFDPAWLEEELDPKLLTWKEGGVVPMVINNQVLTIYNQAYSKSQGLPEVSESALHAPLAKMTYGKLRRSLNDPQPAVATGRVVGMSAKVALGVAIPLDVLAHFHKQLGIEEPAVTEVVLRLTRGAVVERVRQDVTDLGFVINEPHPLARAIDGLHRYGKVAALVLVACLCLFGFAYLNKTLQVLFLLKAEDYGVCRAMGMSLAQLRMLLLFEVLILVLLDLVVGYLLGHGVSYGVNRVWLTDIMGELSQRPPWRALATMMLGMWATAWLFPAAKGILYQLQAKGTRVIRRWGALTG